MFHTLFSHACKILLCERYVKKGVKPCHPFHMIFTHNFTHIHFKLCLIYTKARLYGEKLSRVEGSFALPSYPGRANFSYISLQNLANRLHEKQKVGSAGRVTRLAGSPFFDGRVTLLAGPTFLQPGQLRQGETIRACPSTVGSGKGVNFLLI